MKVIIQTRNEEDMEKALDALQEKLIPYADKGYGAVWKKLGGGRYGLWLTYMTGNRVFDYLVRHEMKSTLKKIDKRVTIEEVKTRKDETAFNEAMSQSKSESPETSSKKSSGKAK